MINYKVVVGFVSGALFGGALGAFLMKSKTEKECRIAIEEVKSYYRDKYGVDIPYKDVKDEPSGAEEKKEEENPDPRPTPSETLKEGYLPEDWKEEYTPEEVKSFTKEDRQNDIYVIEADDYCYTNPHYGKESLSYYIKDRVLVDENMDAVTDPESLVGCDIGNRFAQDFGTSYEDDPIYIRNDKLGVDYEVTPRNAKFYQYEGDIRYD